MLICLTSVHHSYHQTAEGTEASLHVLYWAHANRSHVRYLRISKATCESNNRAIRLFCESKFAHLHQGFHCLQDNQRAKQLPFVSDIPLGIN